MTYQLGSLGQSTWCSTSNPQGSCTPIAGVCKPMNVDTLDVYEKMQRLLNRLLAFKGKTLISVDGRIGKRTVDAVKYTLGADYGSCDRLAADADSVVNRLSMLVISTPNVPTTVPDPPSSSPPSRPSPDGSGQVVHPPLTIGDQLANVVANPMMLAAVGVAGLLVYKKLGKKGRKGVGKKKRSRSRRRRR